MNKIGTDNLNQSTESIAAVRGNDAIMNRLMERSGA